MQCRRIPEAELQEKTYAAKRVALSSSSSSSS
jgi:hypothetical protein